MAKTVFNTEEIQLDDGSVVKLKPARIKTLKKFMEHMKDFGTVEKTEVEVVEQILEGAAILLTPQNDQFADPEYAEEVLDIESCYKILDACGGMKLNDPKLLEAAQQMIAAQMVADQDGTN